jgi:hypothetical protein
MGIMSWLGIGDEIAKPINAVSNLYTTDKERLEGEQKLTETLEKPQLAQLEVNRTLALSSNLFNSGWQPLMGWTSGFLILLYYAPQIIIATIIWGSNCYETGVVTQFPIKPDDILNLVYVLFGFGIHSIVQKGMNKP